MATRNFTDEQIDNIQIKILLKNGKTAGPQDIPPEPFATEGFVSFWAGDDLCLIPVAEIAGVFLIPARQEETDDA